MTSVGTFLKTFANLWEEGINFVAMNKILPTHLYITDVKPRCKYMVTEQTAYWHAKISHIFIYLFILRVIKIVQKSLFNIDYRKNTPYFTFPLKYLIRSEIR